MSSPARRTVLRTAAAVVVAVAALAAQPPAIAATTDAAQCTVTGTSGPDVLRGTSGNDVICALGGGDVVYAGAGDDVVIGGAGDDVVYGGAGDDILVGGAGDDVLLGDSGADTLVGGAGTDHEVGGAGPDRLGAGQAADRGLDVEIHPVYNLPIGSEVTWTSGTGNPKCIKRAAGSWFHRVDGADPGMHFLLEGSSAPDCAGQTVHFRWRVKVKTPTSEQKFVDVTTAVKFSAIGAPVPQGTTACTSATDGLQCAGATTSQSFTPLLPLYVTVTLGPVAG